MLKNKTIRWSPNDYRYYLFHSSLAHHGIIGQHWGTRHGPPYPLDRETSNSVKSKGQREKYLREREEAKLIAAGKKSGKNFENVGTAAMLNPHDKVWKERWNTYGNSFLTGLVEGDENGYSKTNFSYTTKSNPAAGWKYYLVSPVHAVHELWERQGFNYNNREIDDEHIKQMHDDVVNMRINPGFGEDGTTNNCTKVTFATELVRRGAHGDMVEAGRQTYPASGDALSYWFKGAHAEKFIGDDAVSSAQQLIDSYGDKSSGELRAATDHSGHSVHWTRLGDYFSIEDGQCGRVYEGSDFSSAFDAFTNDQPFMKTDVRITRLDNCEVNWDNAAEDGCLRGNRVWNEEDYREVDTW